MNDVKIENWTDRAEALVGHVAFGEACRVGPDGSVYFSDGIDGGVYRWRDGLPLETVIPKRRRVGGIALHADGGMVVSGRDICLVRPGTEDRVLIEPGAGNDFKAFNDLCALADGTILVGCLRYIGYGEHVETPVPGAYVRHDGTRYEELIGGIEFANGCGDSLDGSIVYAVDYANGRVWAREGDAVRPLATTRSGRADGLAIDAEDAIWVVQPDGHGLARFTPDGSLDRIIGLDYNASSIAFDGDALYVAIGPTSPGDRGGLLRLPAPVPGPRSRLTTI